MYFLHKILLTYLCDIQKLFWSFYKTLYKKQVFGIFIHLYVNYFQMYVQNITFIRFVKPQFIFISYSYEYIRSDRTIQFSKLLGKVHICKIQELGQA